jgi:hypothetical protein
MLTVSRLLCATATFAAGAARPGSSNAGHDVWSRIGNDENRRALIE